MKLNDFVRVYDDVINKQTCGQLIDLFEGRYKDSHEVHDNELYKFHQLNLGINDELRQISQRFAQILVPYYNDYFKAVKLNDYVKVQGFEEVRIKRYLKGNNDEFKTHVDVTDKETCVRYLVAIMYLNDNDGVTDFPTLGMTVKPQIGRVVMFPPMWMFPHSGKPPTNSNKYIMMTCLHYV